MDLRNAASRLKHVPYYARRLASTCWAGTVASGFSRLPARLAFFNSLLDNVDKLLDELFDRTLLGRSFCLFLCRLFLGHISLLSDRVHSPEKRWFVDFIQKKLRHRDNRRCNDISAKSARRVLFFRHFHALFVELLELFWKFAGFPFQLAKELALLVVNPIVVE
jgi:hypothetical protein